MVNPTFDNWTTAKRVLRYLKGTTDSSLIYEKGVKDLKVIGYSDNDFVGDVEDRKSTLGHVFFLGGLPITWNNLKQKVVALSLCEAEYIAITSYVCQGVLIVTLVKEVMGIKIEAMKMMFDNQSIIMLNKTSNHHNRTKHIGTHYHFIGDCIEDRRVVIEYVKTEDQLVDILKKSLRRMKFVELYARNGVKEAWDEKKIKEENAGSDFPSQCRAGTRGTVVVHKGEHLACASVTHSMDMVAPTEMVPCGMYWHVETHGSKRYSVPMASLLAGTVAPMEHKPLDAHAPSAHACARHAFREDPTCTCAHISAATIAPTEMRTTVCTLWDGDTLFFNTIFCCFLLVSL